MVNVRWSIVLSGLLVFILMILAVGALSAQSDASALPPAPSMTCRSVPPSIAVFSSNPNVQCRGLSLGGIGSPSLIYKDPINAVDIWGDMNAEGMVCFSGLGKMMFLDATSAPRTLSELESYPVGNGTCAMFDRAGSAVLMPGSPTFGQAPSAPADEPDSAPADEPDSTTPAGEPDIMSAGGPEVDLADCVVTARYNVVFREEPGGRRLGLVWAPTSLAAMARTPNWFNVDKNGKMGWISAHYVNASPACNAN